MSYSTTLNEFIKIINEKGILKTADKKEHKDNSYNVKIPAAGPDDKVERDGAGLIEIAHPNQAFVVDSLRNDGIVENVVDAQKVAINIIEKHPTGILGLNSIMNTLVKVANSLDEQKTVRTRKIADQIDKLLVLIAQQQPTTTPAPVEMPETPNYIGGEGADPSYLHDMAEGAAAGGAAAVAAAVPSMIVAISLGLPGLAIPGLNLVIAPLVVGALGGWLAANSKSISTLSEGFAAAADTLGDLDYGKWYQSTSSTGHGKELQGIINKLKGYASIDQDMSFSNPNYSVEKLKKTFEAVNYVISITPVIERFIENSTDSSWSDDKKEAYQAWNGLLRQCTLWKNTAAQDLQKNNLVQAPSVAAKSLEQIKQKLPEAQQQAAATGSPTGTQNPAQPKQKQHNPSQVNYALGIAKNMVQVLQRLVNVDDDGKFGRETLGAVLNEAKNNSLLDQYINANPKLQKYSGWTQKDVIESINRIVTARNNAKKIQPADKNEGIAQNMLDKPIPGLF